MRDQRRGLMGRVRRTVGSRAILLGVLIATCVAFLVFRSRDVTPTDDGSARILTLRLTPRKPKLVAHATQQLTATGTFSDRSKHDVTAQVRWASNATHVATVDDQGVVTAMAAGEATISAEQGAAGGTTTLTVIDH